MKKKNVTKLMLVCILTIGCVFTLFGCGSKTKKVDGYYTMTADAQVGTGHDHYAIEIDGSDVVFHTDRYGQNSYNVTGYVEYGDDGKAKIYLSDITQCSYSNYCPLYVELSDDGKRMYLSSDNSDWSTDTYDVVSKSDLEAFVEEHFTATSGDTPAN